MIKAKKLPQGYVRNPPIPCDYLRDSTTLSQKLIATMRFFMPQMPSGLWLVELTGKPSQKKNKGKKGSTGQLGYRLRFAAAQASRPAALCMLPHPNLQPLKTSEKPSWLHDSMPRSAEIPVIA